MTHAASRGRFASRSGHLRTVAAATVTAVLLAGCATAGDDEATDTALQATDTSDDSGPRYEGDTTAEPESAGRDVAVGAADGATRGSGAVTAESDAVQPPPDDGGGGDVIARSAGISPFFPTAEDALSTFALDVDAASWTQTVAWLDSGQRPPAAIVRPEEFLNYFEYGYPAPDDGWAVHVDGLEASPWNPATALLRVGLKTAEIDPADRPDATLTFVVDVSGSMSGQPLQTVKDTLLLLADQLRPSDRIGLVTYGSEARVLLPPTPLAESDDVVRAIESLQPGGSTYAEAGLRAGYDLAAQHLTPGGIHAVVLASDGVANVGATGPDEILQTVREGVDVGINLLALGVSANTTYNDYLMEQLANNGNGSVYYINGRREAERLFVDNLESTLVVVAQQSKVQVAFDPAAVTRWRLVGYENRDVADEDFRNDDVDAGEVGAGHEVTALYELELVDNVSDGPVGTVHLRWEDPLTREVTEIERIVSPVDLVPDVATEFGTAVQAAAFAEILRGSPHVGELTVDSLLDLLPELDTAPELVRAIESARTANPAPGS